MLEKSLKQKGEEGFFLGPQEEFGSFIQRVNYLKEISLDPDLFLKKQEIVKKWELIDKKEWEYVFKKNRNKLHFTPTWIIAFYSDDHLMPWQGALTWICEVKGISFSLVQLRKGFKKGKWLWYSRDEILLHESFHAVRQTFQEPIYEEIFAFSFLKTKWRSFFGPFFRKTSQVYIFIFSIFISIIAQVFLLFTFRFSFILEGLVFLPFIYLAIKMGALIRDHFILKKALKKIQVLFPKQSSPLNIAFHFTDREIRKFAFQPFERLASYIKEQSVQSLRWQQILLLFS